MSYDAVGTPAQDAAAMEPRAVQHGTGRWVAYVIRPTVHGDAYNICRHQHRHQDTAMKCARRMARAWRQMLK